MRIKCKIASARFQWMSRFPVFNEKIERDMTDGEGHLDESKARRVLADVTFDDGSRPIEFSSSDNKPVIALAVEFLSQMRSISERLARDDSNDVHLEAKPGNSVDKRINERMTKDDILGVFFDFDKFGGLPRCRVRIKGEKLNLKCTSDQQKLKSALEFSAFAVRVLRHLKREIENHANGEPRIVLGEIGDYGILKRAAEIDAAEAAEDELKRRVEGRAMCPQRSASGYCTPICPDCEFGCYSRGRCVEPKID